MKNRKLVTLALLDSKGEQNLIGRTRLQKLLFLIQQRLDEQGQSLNRDYDFIAYDYGPFSQEIYEDVETLIERGLVSEDATKLDDGVIQYSYELTEKGRERLSDATDKMGDRMEVVEETKSEFYDEELQDLIDYVYAEYPEYAENSVLY
jgi:uncharacterized protein YwgA